jgi:hypothetical protein
MTTANEGTEMEQIDHLYDLIRHYKQEAVGILRTHYSDEEIKSLCTTFAFSDDPAEVKEQFNKDGHPESTFLAVASLVSLMHLEAHTPNSPDYLVPSETLADLMVNSFNAMLALGEASTTPMYPYALRGQKFIGKKIDALSRLLDTILEEHYHKNEKFPSWHDVVGRLRREVANSLIDYVDMQQEQIGWGTESTSFVALRDRITESRKRILQKHTPKNK